HEVRLIDPPGPWGDGGGVGEARAGAVAGRGTRGVIERRCAGTVVHSLELSWPPTGAEARAGLAWGGWTRGAPRKMVPSIRRVAGSWINSDRRFRSVPVISVETISSRRPRKRSLRIGILEAPRVLNR